MGRSSNKTNKYSGGGGGGGGGDDAEASGMKHSAEYEQKQIEMLLHSSQQQRMTWEEYKEKHKSQLEDRLGAGMESDQREYRKMLDAERNSKLARGHNHKALAGELEKEKEKKRLKKDKKKAKKEKKKEKKEKKSKKDKKDKKEGKEKKRKRDSEDSQDSEDSDGDSSSSSSSSSNNEREGRKKKSKKSNKDERGDSPEGFGVRLSDFHAGVHDDSD